MHLVESLRAKVDRLALGSARSSGALRASARSFARALAAPLVIGRASRTVSVPGSTPPLVVCVGGPAVGGSGKTPVAIACAKALAAHGIATAFVGHGYRAPGLGLRDVVEAALAGEAAGDEARVAAAQLRDAGVPVLVARSRSRAVAAAAERARVVVLDGPLETRPLVATLTVLACADADTGTLARVLAARAHEVVPTGVGASTFRLLRGGAHAPIESLAGQRFGLVTAIARPERAVAAFGHHSPVAHVALGNHARLDPRSEGHAAAIARSARLDAWVTTEKGPLFGETTFAGLPLYALRHEVVLPARLLLALGLVAARATIEVGHRSLPESANQLV